MPTTAEFIADHPICCFCGGSTLATTEDHVPPKILFVRKEWPEGYVFPACGPCNHGSRQLDQTVALLAQCSVDDANYNHATFSKVLGGVRNNSPTAEPHRITSGIEIRKILRHLGAEKPPDVAFLQDLNIAGIPVETFRAIDPALGKLFCALHYMHAGSIVPAGAAIFVQRTTNQIRVATDPFGWLNRFPTPNRPVIKRSSKSLADQFDYSWGLDAGGTFAIKFHLRYGIYGVMVGPITEPDILVEEVEHILHL